MGDVLLYILAFIPFILSSAFIGVFMFLSDPIVSDFDKSIYVVSLIFSLSILSFGIKKRKFWWGKLFIVCGIVIWCSAGILGLGTSS